MALATEPAEPARRTAGERLAQFKNTTNALNKNGVCLLNLKIYTGAPELSIAICRLTAVQFLEAGMTKRMIVRVAAATVLFISAAVPVWAALAGNINYMRHGQPVAPANVVSVNDTAGPECGPVYVPKMVHERDGSIVGMTFVVDGDDC